MSDKVREEFEESVCAGEICEQLFTIIVPYSTRKKQVSACFIGGKYENDILNAAWNTWKASRAAQCVELPRIGVLHHSTTYSAPDVRAALDEAGVRYK